MALVRLQYWMNDQSIILMNEQDRKISGIVAEERSRLRNFIRRRVGQVPVSYPYPAFAPVLDATAGLPLFCEQVTLLELPINTIQRTQTVIGDLIDISLQQPRHSEAA